MKRRKDSRVFQRVAIINRGEAAMRLIHAVKELSAETATQIETIAFYTDVDSTATFVREADQTYALGAASARPYLDLKVLRRALIETQADAAWVGWGFVAEDPAFAELCDEIGVAFVGPSASAMQKLGDKIGAKLIAEKVGVPVAPWSRGAVETVEAALAAASTIGYPLMLKATAGGGGRGIRVITNEADLVDAFERTRQEAARAFGSGVVFLERLVTGARHVEVQVIADGRGTAWALGVRDCSVQRRNQKIIEESASPVLDAARAAELKTSAERLALEVGYRGAATVEFLYHPGDQQLAFLEVNTRLQVEHPITEATTGFDLVKAQLWIASGGRLQGDMPVERGHAIEARLNAEDPDRDFAPAPGRIARLALPSGPGVRVDTGVSEGDTIAADFDSMIAKIIVHGRDRAEALGRLRHAMSQTTVIIEGGATNKSFVLDLLDQPEIVDATVDTGWIDRVRGEGRLMTHRHTAIALAAAAIETYEQQEHSERQRLLTTAFGGRPQVQHDTGRPLDLQIGGASYRIRVARVGPNRFRIAIDMGDEIRTADIKLDRFDRNLGQIDVNGSRHRLLTSRFGPTHLVEVDGVAHRVSRDEGGVVRSPAPALVVATPLALGAEVEAGQPVLVLESMKMETVLRAPFTSRLKESFVSVGTQVETGVPLLRLEPVATEEQTPEAAPIELDLPSGRESVPVGERVQLCLDDLRSLLLGFDVDPHQEGRALDEYLAARRELNAEGHRPLAEELVLVDAFVDLAELSHNRPADDHNSSHIHSAREYFHIYLQSLDVDRAGLPEVFQNRVARALNHYGVADLERSLELEAAVFRIFLAQQHSSANAAVLAALLRAWLREPPPEQVLRERVGQALQRLTAATQVRFPAVADLSRGVEYAWFGQPLLRRNRARIYTGVRKHLRHLDIHPDAPDREERVAEMARSTEPLVRLLSQRLSRRNLDNSVMLEVLTRRYYGNKDLASVRASEAYGCTFVIAERSGSQVVSCAVGFDELGNALHGLAEWAVGERTLDVDIYLRWERQPEDFDAMAATLRDVLSSVQIPSQVARLTVAVAGRRGAMMHHHFTFRRSDAGIEEERLIRGLHPYIARRMQMQRLSKFDLTRVSSSDDEEVYLFRAVAQDNPLDDRLVALAQVRDLAELRDADGRLVALPTMENTLATCLDSIRRAQSQRPPSRQFNTNRIMVYVWPPSEITRAELDAIARKLLPTADGAGLEEILFIARQRGPKSGSLTKIALHLRFDAAGGAEVLIDEPSEEPIEPLDDYRLKVLRARSRNTVYPYEFTDLLGDFTEYDFDSDRTLRPVDRPKGRNTAAMVVGLVTTPTPRHPQGITRVVLLGDPTKSLGALSEPECQRIIAALDLAEQMHVPLDWIALSSGARISMKSGTENMDWVAAALKKIVEFTQAGGEINIIVAGINVGAQPYWNAEATMLMHTKGILVMTPESTMVLTGKRALDLSGGVSAEDNFGIGGYDRVMGPNGQAQYWAPDLVAARDILMSHYDHTYIAPGERHPRSTTTTDPIDRNVCEFPHTLAGNDFTRVGDIFSAEANPDRKKPFDIRAVMRAVADQDQPTLERWVGMADAETAVVQDVHLGGTPACMIGIESRPVPRRGIPPADGPDTYTAGTLFPQSSKKIARAVNAASGNRPLVILGNLSGFDGSPESLRKLQLEYGAEIGRAIVNFTGPIVFCVLSRYHGGAFVVFSKALNPDMTVLAVEGSFASVLGGAPAAAVVFAADVEARTEADPRVQSLANRAAAVSGVERAALRAELDELRSKIRTEKIGDVATEFDRVHSIQRAVEVGSVDAVIPAAELRPRIIEAIHANA
jgi:acetyl/propionyl-CoA carboxylase alpha subunit/acetyl-CoA carboxylase carboxyltransferase component